MARVAYQSSDRKKIGNSGNGKSQKKPVAVNWPACVAAFNKNHLSKFAKWRGLSPDFCQWLVDAKLVGIYKGQIAFPVQGVDGEIIGCHNRLEDGSWRFQPSGVNVLPLIFGDPIVDGAIALIFESQWDAFAVADKFGLNRPGDAIPKPAFFVTRGASNGSLVRGWVPTGHPQVFVFRRMTKRKMVGVRVSNGWKV
jgi:hypothetical protein